MDELGRYINSMMGWVMVVTAHDMVKNFVEKTIEAETKLLARTLEHEPTDGLSEPRRTKDMSFLAKNNPRSDSPRQTPVNPRQKEWIENAIRKYAEAQEKQWRHWNEAMFEPD